MSEQARIASLQEKIKEARNEERNYDIWASISGFSAGGGFALYFSLNRDLFFLVLGIAGVIGVLLFGTVSFLAKKTKTQLMKELDSLSMKVPTCQKCGKQIPQGNFTFCPFCGTALENASV
jgi:uncharacterized membrane protein YjjP (DUF1212 family)